MKKICFNKSWTYYKDGEEKNKRKINLPHDAMIWERRDAKCDNSYNSGFYPGGKYIYEKTFDVPREYEKKSIIIEFEGVYRDSKVFLNDVFIGGHQYGYSNFYINLSGKLLIGESNRIKVVADNSQTPNSRWYSGSGIYRDVNMYIGERSYIDMNGVKVKTNKLKNDYAEIAINISNVIQEEGNFTTKTSIYFNEDLIDLVEGESLIVDIKDPHLWSAQVPNLYRYVVKLFKNDIEIDKQEGSFGIRIVEADPKKGLIVNGKNVILLGACIHHDNGVIGATTLREAERRRVKILKENGFNAIRSAHNPISKHLLEACDEFGMYVMDEAFDMWFSYKTEFDYAKDFRDCWEVDIEAMVHKDYNHPSVIMYSIGNEIYDTPSPRAIEMTKRIINKINSIDSSRLIINCINPVSVITAETTTVSPEEFDPKVEKAPGINLLLESREGNDFMLDILAKLPEVLPSEEFDLKTKDLFALLDVVGYNYATMAPEVTREKYPNRINCGSENFPEEIIDNYRIATTKGTVIGDFVWTGWDYIGEACIGSFTYGNKDEGLYKGYPALLAGCGIIDITGFPTQQAYFRQIVCEQISGPYITVRPMNLDIDQTQVSVWRQYDGISSWSWDGYEGKPAEIEVFSSGSYVEIKINGEKKEKQPVINYCATFSIPYETGEIEAIQYDENNRETGRDKLFSAGNKTKIKLDVDNRHLVSNGMDLSFISIELVDENDIVKVLDNNEIEVKVSGAGHLAGLGSGNPMTEDEYTSGKCYPYWGRALLVVRSSYESGDINIEITSGNLKENLLITASKSEGLHHNTKY